jgi:hypothetical protein
MALMNKLAKSHAQHIAWINANLDREMILPIGALVATPNVFGLARVGVIISYGLCSTFAEELAGVKKYTIQGLNGEELGRVERSEDQIFIIAKGE